MATAELASTSGSDGGASCPAVNGWTTKLEPHPHVTYSGGQASFPGGWLELGSEALRRVFSMVPVVASAGAACTGNTVPVPLRLETSRSGGQGTAKTCLPRPLRWVAESQTYVEAPKGEELQVSRHSLDQSPEVLQLATTVESWGGEVKGRVQEAERLGVLDSEGQFYVKIATALATKLATSEAQQKQDYASEVIALRTGGGQLVGVMDCYERSKTHALVLKYALAHPACQRRAAEREDGTLGGVGRACLHYLLSRAAQDSRVRCVRMEALSLRLYLSAASLGFEQIGTTVPPLPRDVFIPQAAALCAQTT